MSWLRDKTQVRYLIWAGSPPRNAAAHRPFGQAIQVDIVEIRAQKWIG